MFWLEKVGLGHQNNLDSIELSPCLIDMSNQLIWGSLRIKNGRQRGQQSIVSFFTITYKI